MPYRVSVDRKLCTGCGTCVSICDNFELFEGKARPKKAVVREPGCNREAEEMCPVHAITVREIK